MIREIFHCFIDDLKNIERENEAMSTWKNKRMYEKITDVIAVIAACVWVVFEILQWQGVLWAVTAGYATVSVICFCQTISCWKKQRILSYFMLVCAICLFAGTILSLT